MFGGKKNDDNSLDNDDVVDYAEIEILEENHDAVSEEIIGSASQKFIKPSVISEGFTFNGDVEFNGSLTVDGSIQGNIIVDHLVIGVAGSVGGVIKAKTINVKGKLLGTISCSEIVVGGRSVVEGNLTYTSITIQRGGEVKGDLRRI